MTDARLDCRCLWDERGEEVLEEGDPESEKDSERDIQASVALRTTSGGREENGTGA